MRIVYLIIVAAVLVPAFGGFIFDAEDVTTCKTDFDYVAEVSGAFRGDKSDIVLDYNPAANVTGYSYNLLPVYNNGWMSGVYFNPAAPNTFPINGSGDGMPTVETDEILTFAPDPDHPNRAYKITGTVSGDLGTLYLTMPVKTLRIPDQASRILDSIPVKSVLNLYSSANKIITIELTPVIPTIYPGLFNDGDLTYSYNAWRFTGNTVTELVYDTKTELVEMGGNKFSVNNAYIGVTRPGAQGEPVGDVTSFSLSIQIVAADSMSYVNPASGVIPKTETERIVSWNNNQLNTSVSMILTNSDLSGAAIGHVETKFTFYDQTNYDPVRIEYNNGVWRANGSYSILIGAWPAIMVTNAAGQITINPISSFSDFNTYAVVNTPISIPWSANLGDLIGFTVETMNGTDSFRMQVVQTTVRVPEGGLYLQNAELTPAVSFPNYKGVMLMFGSSVHIGNSITFTSGNDTATLLTDINGVTINGKTYPFNGIKFAWVSDTMDPVIIGSETFPAALYMSNTYASGAVWAIAGAEVIHIIDGNAWTLRLDGVWAPAVFLYEGENHAATKTEISDFGSYHWNLTEIIITFMGVMIIGGMLATYITKRFDLLGGTFEPMSAVDWIIIFGAVAAAAVFL